MLTFGFINVYQVFTYYRGFGIYLWAINEGSSEPMCLSCSHTQSMDVGEYSRQNLDLYARWTRQYGRLLEAFVHMRFLTKSSVQAHVICKLGILSVQRCFHDDLSGYAPPSKHGRVVQKHSAWY